MAPTGSGIYPFCFVETELMGRDEISDTGDWPMERTSFVGYLPEIAIIQADLITIAVPLGIYS